MDFTDVALFISEDDSVIRAIHSTGPSVCSFEDTELGSAEQVDSFMQLFAAAPDLLAALKYMKEVGCEFYDMDMGENGCAALEQAAAAIAKAEGGAGA